MSKDTNHGRSITVRPKGKFLLHLRKDQRQKDVEEAAGLPALRLSLYERGNPIPLGHLERLANHYDIPARELVEPESLEAVFCMARTIKRVFEMLPSEEVPT